MSFDLYTNAYDQAFLPITMNCDIALILAAGRGERLRPITDSIPKPLIEVGKHRLIEYHIQNLAKSGVKKIYINRAHLRQQFDELLFTKHFPDLEISYLDEPDGALETAGAIINTFAEVDSEKLLVVNGDIWCDYNFNNIKDLPDSNKDNAHIVLVTNPNHNPHGDFSIQNGRLIEKTRGLSYTFSGIGIYRRRLFANQKIEFKKLAPVLHEQITLGLISASIHTGEWMDIGTVERLESLRAKLKKESL